MHTEATFIWLKYSKIINIYSNIVKYVSFKNNYFYLNIFWNVIYSVKLNFQQPLLQSLVSHDPSEILHISYKWYIYLLFIF